MQQTNRIGLTLLAGAILCAMDATVSSAAQSPTSAPARIGSHTQVVPQGAVGPEYDSGPEHMLLAMAPRAKQSKSRSWGSQRSGKKTRSKSRQDSGDSLLTDLAGVLFGGSSSSRDTSYSTEPYPASTTSLRTNPITVRYQAPTKSSRSNSSKARYQTPTTSSRTISPTVRYQTPTKSSRTSSSTVRYQTRNTSSRTNSPTVRYQAPTKPSRTSSSSVRYQAPTTSSRTSTPTVRYQAPTTSSRTSSPTVRYQAPTASSRASSSNDRYQAPATSSPNVRYQAPSARIGSGMGSTSAAAPGNGRPAVNSLGTGSGGSRRSSFIDLGNTSSGASGGHIPSLYGARGRSAAEGRATPRALDSVGSTKRADWKASASGTSRPSSSTTPTKGAQASGNARNTLRAALLERYRAGGQPTAARAGLNTTLGKRYGTRSIRAGSPAAPKSPPGSGPDSAKTALGKSESKLKSSPLASGATDPRGYGKPAPKPKGSTATAPGARPKAGGRWSGMSSQRAAEVRALAQRRTAFTPRTSPKKVRYDNMKIGAMDGLAQTSLKTGSRIATGLAGAPLGILGGSGSFGGYGNGKGSYWDNYRSNCWSDWYWSNCWSYWDCWSNWGPWLSWWSCYSSSCSSYYSYNFWWPSYTSWWPSYPSNNTTIIYQNDPAPVEVTVIVDGSNEDVSILAGEGAVINGTQAIAAAPDQDNSLAGVPAQPLGRAAEYYLSLGDQAFADGRYDTAVQLYTRAVQYAPDQGILHLILADALFATGDYSPCAAHLRTALALDPLLASTIFDKHSLYTDPTDFDRQLATLELFLRDHPLLEDARLVLAFNLLFGGRPAAAVELLEEPFSANLATTLPGALLLETARLGQFG
ncbi:MAG: hypothetical protein CMJ87_03845 [Planctomycetes bacterium]|nr:hypothetical protein [Planctomycetota bacterium]